MDINDYDFLVDVKMSPELIKPYCLWAIVKFRKDNYHTQYNSSRGDFLGGFLDRWVNKIPEYFIFEELLEKFNRADDYSIINDYFFYYSESSKNAPDVLGLKREEGENSIFHKFATFNNDSWNIKNDAPLIEVKTFRESQRLITIPKNQLEKNSPDDNENIYYAIVYAEDNLNKNYLLNLLDRNIFDIKPSFYYNSDFIKSDLDLLDFPDNAINEELIRIKDDLSSEYIGSYRLAGIYKWNDIKDYAICVGTENNDPNKDPVKPFYLKSISDKNCNIMSVSGEFEYYSDNYDCIPILIIMDKSSKCHLISFKENSIILSVEGNVELLNITDDYNDDNIFPLDSGFHEIKFCPKIVNLTNYYTLFDSIKLPSDFEKKEYLCELKSGIFNYYGNKKFFNNIFDSKKYLESDYKIINYSQEKIYFLNEDNSYCFEFKKGLKNKTTKIDEHNVKNILKEEKSDITINLNFLVDSDSSCKFISKTKDHFIISVEGNVTVSEVGDNEKDYPLEDGFHKFEINNNKSIPHIKSCSKNISLKDRDFQKEMELDNGFYLPESDSSKFTSVKLKVEYLSDNSKIFIVKEKDNKNGFYKEIIVNGKVRIDGEIFEDYSKNFEKQWKLSFEKFDRSSKEEEYIISRNSLICSHMDSSNELIDVFDNIVNQNLFID